jgi:hypothetical protein
MHSTTPVRAASSFCDLSALSLVGLGFHDSNGEGFEPAQHTYASNIGVEAVSTRVRIDSAAAPVAVATATFELIYASADGGAPFRQYLQLNQPSALLPLTSGTNTLSIHVSVPATCTSTYTVSLHKAGSSGFVVGDPQFTGLRGQQFQVHAASGEVYNIISDRHVQVNCRFVYLDGGNCPILHGRRAHGCWSHPGSYLGEIGIKTSNGDQIRVLSGHAREGFERVTINDRPVPVGVDIELPFPDEGEAGPVSAGMLSFNSSHLLTIQVSNFRIELENSDLFINQRVRVIDWPTLHAHGLLGQTWKGRIYRSPNGGGHRHIEGTIDDYLVRGKNIFGEDFTFNQFRDLTQ